MSDVVEKIVLYGRFGAYAWEARAVLARPLRRGSLVVLPTGGMVKVGEGQTLTAWGARRAARRAIAYATDKGRQL